MLAQQARGFAWLGMAAQLFLAEEQGVVRFYFKAPAAGWQQREAGNLVDKFPEQFVRQTGGAWCVISLDAKFDAERIFVHTSLLYIGVEWNTVADAHVANRLINTETAVDRMIY
jgi:hypothetical protein